MLKKSVLLFTGMLFLLSRPSIAAGDFGIGLVLGEPTGISAKYWLSQKSRALDFALAWSLNRRDHIYMHADYLWHYIDPLGFGSSNFLLYHGVGPRLILSNNPNVGARASFGMEFIIKDVADVFLELVPVLELVPDTDVDINFGLGFRYFF
jgi:hypothetical protein